MIQIFLGQWKTKNCNVIPEVGLNFLPRTSNFALMAAFDALMNYLVNGTDHPRVRFSMSARGSMNGRVRIPMSTELKQSRRRDEQDESEIKAVRNGNVLAHWHRLRNFFSIGADVNDRLRGAKRR